MAFTLVELVVALGLGALLMTALVGVLKSVDRQLDEVRLKTQSDWSLLTGRLLYRDLLFASRISSVDGWIWLEGTFPGYGATGRIDKVGYRCAESFAAGETALMRWANGRGEPVVLGPRRIQIERLDSSGVPQPLSALPTPISGEVRVWIWMDGDTPAFTKDFVLH